MAQKAAFATGVPPNICAFHRYTGNSTFLYHIQVYQFEVRAEVELRALTPRLIDRLRALYAQ